MNEQNPEEIPMNKITIDISEFDKEPDTSNLYILPTRNLVLFPGVTIPIALGRNSSLELARKATEERLPIGVVCQTDPSEENPGISQGLYKYGVIADVLKVIELPDGSVSAVIRARGKFRILGRGSDGFALSARIRRIEDREAADPEAFHAIAQSVRNEAEALFKSHPEGGAVLQNLRQADSDEALINFVATHLPMEVQEKIALLMRSHIDERAAGVRDYLLETGEKFAISNEIAAKTRKAMDENQRTAFLQQQMDTIREELYGNSEEEIDVLIRKAEKEGMPRKVLETFMREAEKARHYNPQSPDYAVQYSYLEMLSSLPWKAATESNKDIEKAAEILEEDHYGLERLKERVLEQLAVLMHNPSGKAPILCLVGPPGVGKTSVGKSIARALGRKYERVSLGGLHDEAEIRGHRRTYVGAMPGRIIAAMKRAEVVNPVIVLDEIDKIGADFKGDPASALLEVLDPAQNNHFHDNYIDVDYDLSKVLFIATANSLAPIARPLLDRMEVMDISGYIIEEKLEIARRHLLPTICEEYKLDADELRLSDAGLRAVVETYTNESGVRQLEKKLSSLARKAVLAKLRGKRFPSPIEPEDLYDLLGLALREKDEYEGNDIAGVVTGLAWTETGGEILLAESSVSPGKGGKLVLTGNLGEVMRESATIAYQWVQAHASQLGIEAGAFEKNTLHVHFPEGAIPKDGPSAGITIATSIASTFKGVKVASGIAMTGEITLRGKVLPVGGIKEKILAAKRAGIHKIILSEKNKRDIEDIAPVYLEGMKFIYVATVDDVMREALTTDKAATPQD
ncbi:MAG: endopeptidase La [Muribaculaceae bacterium]|nr:endopeptidase La [Muribaculaceae bacterium]